MHHLHDVLPRSNQLSIPTININMKFIILMLTIIIVPPLSEGRKRNNFAALDELRGILNEVLFKYEDNTTVAYNKSKSNSNSNSNTANNIEQDTEECNSDKYAGSLNEYRMMDGLVSSDDHAASLKNKQSSIFHHSSIVRNKNNPIPGVNLNTANANANANVSSFRRHFIPCGGLTLTNINTSNSGTGFFPTEYDEDDNASEQGDNGDDCLSTASTQVI